MQYSFTANMLIKVLVFLCVLQLNCIINVKSANILAVLPSPAKSHWILAHNLLLELINSGHDVTIITPHPLKTPRPNYTDVPVPEIVQRYETEKDALFNIVEGSVFAKIERLFYAGHEITNFTLKHPNVQRLLKSDKKFDLIFMEIFVNEALLGLGQYYKAPIVLMSTVGPTIWINSILGSPQPLSYMPNLFLDYTDKMSFKQRFHNAIVSIAEFYYMNTFYMDLQRNLYNEVFPDPKPDFDYVRFNSVALGLVNSHFSLTFPTPKLPNTIETGGMHISYKRAPLPDDIREFIESAEHGVIYFSMGSYLSPSGMPKLLLEQIFSALLKMEQKILWKWDEPEFFVKSDRIMIKNWFPQNDILAHSNTRLFITHGGLLGTTEAVFHGVPVIGIPVFGDQSLNMARMVNNGVGLRIDFKNLTESSISWALHEIIDNEKYTIKMKEMSKRFRDQPQTPLQTAKFWVEYVLRNKGAKYLHSPAQDLSFIQYHMLDVWLTLIGGFIAALLIVFTIIMLLIKLLKIIFRSSDKFKDQ